MKREAGLTLIEVLLAVTLVSLLSVGILYALRIGLTTMERAGDRLMWNRRVMGVDRVLRLQIGNLMAVKAACGSAEGGRGAMAPFFQGEPQTMRFVSSYSLQEAARGYPRILEFQVIPGEHGRGVRLVVNEPLYSGPLSAGALCTAPGQFVPVQTGTQSFVLADNLEHCSFSYRRELQAPEFQVWQSVWTQPRPPSAIRIDMAPLEPGAGKLQIMSVTAPVRVTRNPMEEYVN